MSQPITFSYCKNKVISQWGSAETINEMIKQLEFQMF